MKAWQNKKFSNFWFLFLVKFFFSPILFLTILFLTIIITIICSYFIIICIVSLNKRFLCLFPTGQKHLKEKKWNNITVDRAIFPLIFPRSILTKSICILGWGKRKLMLFYFHDKIKTEIQNLVELPSDLLFSYC